MKIPAYFFAWLLSISFASAQTFEWAAQFGGNDYETGEDIATDAAGNVYLVGIFNGAGDFDPGVDTALLSSAGAQDVYVAKLDSMKNLIWAVRAGGAQQDFAYAISVHNDDVYVSGRFRDSVDFDPGPNISMLVAAGGTDIFILKLDTSGTFGWVKQVGGSGDDVAEDMTADHDGNILVCGQFQDTADFDPGAGTYSIISAGSADAYVLKLDSAGNLIWAKTYGNTPGQFANSIAVNTVNDVFVTGSFYGTTDFDPDTAASFNMSTTGFNSNVYVLKWSGAGNFIWAVNMGNSSGGDTGYSIDTDPAGDAVVTGSYFGTVDFDPGNGTYNLTSTGSNGDVFIIKLNGVTSALAFAKSIGGSGLDQAYDLDVDGAGNIFVTGFFSLTCDFDPDTGAYNLTASGPGDIFIAEFDNTGIFDWVAAIGGSDNDFGRGVQAVGANLYATGVFAFTADFDPGPNAYNISSFSTSSDPYLLKLGLCHPSSSSQILDLCPGDSILAGGSYQTQPGTYYDVYPSASGCDSIVTANVQYTFIADIGSDAGICPGQPFVLDAGILNASYLWSTGDTTQTITVTAPGTYWVSILYLNCMQHDTIVLSPLNAPQVTLGNDTLICLNQSVTYDAGPGFTSYFWSNGSTLQTLTINGSSGSGFYLVAVTVTDIAGCFGSDTANVTVSECAGIAEEDAPVFVSIGPVPADEYVAIASATPIDGWKLADITGHYISEKETKGNSGIIPLDHIAPGIYLLQIRTGHSWQTKKLLVIHAP